MTVSVLNQTVQDSSFADDTDIASLRFDSESSYIINGDTVEVVSNYKYLGTITDDKYRSHL